MSPVSRLYSQNSSTVRQPIGRFWVIQAHWQVARQLQLHCQCLSRLNLFIPCVCTFTYLSSLISSMAEECPCCSVKLYCCKSHNCEHLNIPEYTQSISGRTRISETTRVRQMRGKWYIDTDIPLFRVRGPLSWSMWGSLRLAPIKQRTSYVTWFWKTWLITKKMKFNLLLVLNASIFAQWNCSWDTMIVCSVAELWTVAQTVLTKHCSENMFFVVQLFMWAGPYNLFPSIILWPHTNSCKKRWHLAFAPNGWPDCYKERKLMPLCC